MRSMAMAKAHPPDQELAQTEKGPCNGEGHAVVGLDRLGQTELVEDALEHAERVRFVGAAQRLAAEQIAAGKVGDGQGYQ
jgi:hypothetical protein